MKKSVVLLIAAVVMMFTLGGCQVIRIEEEERKAVEYTVVNQEEIPREAAMLIEQKKEKEFQMTYESSGQLYLIKGYGRQMSGGYSIAVEELSQNTTGIFFKTNLIGPDKQDQTGEPSYPYLVVKMPYTEKPVQFL